MIRQNKRIFVITSIAIVFTLNIILFSSLAMSFKINREIFNENFRLSADPSDTTAPTYSDLTVSSDPLILGDIEVFSINAYDDAGIKKVEIILEGNKKNMIFIGGSLWQYNKWTPSSIGTYTYTINIEDRNGNVNSTGGTVKVINIALPTFYDLTESSDPLELGDQEIISINAYSEAGIDDVKILIDDIERNMRNVGGDTWQYDEWFPNSVGNYSYTIFIRDNDGHGNSTEGLIEVIDTTAPDCIDLTNNSMVSELGEKKHFLLNATDLSGIDVAYIRLDKKWWVMDQIGEKQWIFNSWAPTQIGEIQYHVYIRDIHNNHKYIDNYIQVIDTTKPYCKNLTNNSRALELGDLHIISIKAIDLSGIKEAFFIMGDDNNTWNNMSSIGNNVWQYDTWIPESISINSYFIVVFDNNDNSKVIEGSIEVVDTTKPVCTFTEDKNEILLGNNLILSLKANDLSGIKNITIEFEGNLFLMDNVNLDKWEYIFSNLDKTGTFEYKLIIEDNANNTLILYRNFTVFSEENSGDNLNNVFPLVPILGLLGVIGAVASIAISVVKVKKSKTNKKLKELSNKNPLKSKKSFILEREHLELEAKNATKLGDYTKAAELYGKCKSISNQLFKEGFKNAGSKRSFYANLETEAMNIDTTMAITATCINELMTEFGNENGIWYYSEPQIYYNSLKMTDGLILNEKEYFKSRVDALCHEEGLSSEVALNLFNIEHVKAIQFIYTNDISTKNFLELVINFQTPDIMLFIVCLRWSKYQKNIVLKLPQDSRIKYRENICILTHELFRNLIGLDIKYSKIFNKIIKLNNEMNNEGLKKFHDSNEVLTHDTKDLKDDLLKMGLIEKDFCDYFQIPVDINGSEVLLRSIPQNNVKKSIDFPKDSVTHIIPVICPICKIQKKIMILDTIISQAKQLTTISILKGLLCEHGFQFFVDKNFKVRGYQKVDVELDDINTNQIAIVDD